MTELSGLVVAAHGQRGVVELADGSRQPYLVKGRRLRVLCGDRITARRRESDALLVTAVQPRTNTLARVARRNEVIEVLAANLTRMLVVCAPQPPPDLFLLDRYLCAAELMGVAAVLVWNKCDLEPAPAPRLTRYSSLGYLLVTVSARTGAGLAKLVALLDGEIGALVGQSGTGKTSLINALAPEAAAAVGGLSASGRAGRHTTTAVLMYRVGTGRLIDTPGVRDFIPALDARQRLETGFREFAKIAHLCSFANCRHLAEPACAVRAAVAAGDIDQRRYDSYRRLCRIFDTQNS